MSLLLLNPDTLFPSCDELLRGPRDTGTGRVRRTQAHAEQSWTRDSWVAPWPSPRSHTELRSKWEGVLQKVCNPFLRRAWPRPDPRARVAVLHGTHTAPGSLTLRCPRAQRPRRQGPSSCCGRTCCRPLLPRAPVKPGGPCVTCPDTGGHAQV